jgi:hypothetical protein
MGWIFFVSTSKKKRCRKQVVVGVVVCSLLLFALEEERRRRDGGREKRAEKSKPGRDGDAEAEKNASVAWSRGRRFFERGKERIRAFVFYFFVVPEFSLSSTQRALCVVARDHCTHFASLGRASSSSSSVGPGGGGGDVKRGGRTR